MIKYFISYRCRFAGEETGFGNVEIARNEPIRGTEDIQSIQQSIKDNSPGRFDWVIIINWKRFEE